MEEGDARVCLDSRHPEVDVPANEKNNSSLNLVFNLNFRRPIKITDEGIFATLAFSGRPYKCTLPCMNRFWLHLKQAEQASRVSKQSKGAGNQRTQSEPASRASKQSLQAEPASKASQNKGWNSRKQNQQGQQGSRGCEPETRPRNQRQQAEQRSRAEKQSRAEHSTVQQSSASQGRAEQTRAYSIDQTCSAFVCLVHAFTYCATETHDTWQKTRTPILPIFYTRPM